MAKARKAAALPTPAAPILPAYESLAQKLRDAHKAAGYPIDENGIRRLLVSLRALGLVDYADPFLAPTMKPDVRT